MKAKIKTPCDADWSQMKIGLNARFCEQCNLHVQDFTRMGKEEILKYLLENQDRRVCGRVHRSQLDFSSEDWLVTVRKISRQKQRSNMAYYLLTMLSLSMLATEAEATIELPKDKTEQTIQGTFVPLVSSDTIPSTSELEYEEVLVGDVEIIDVPLTGMVGVEQLSIPDENNVFTFVEQMPEFVGGMDSLYAFISKKLVYPKTQKTFSGRVFAQFIVSETGKVTDVKIVKGINGVPEADQAVLDVFELMPDWIPGKQDDKEVAVRMVIPVQFEL